MHGSLKLIEVLRGCRRTLAARLPIGRLSLAQHRENDYAATLCSLDAGADAALIGPSVIGLEPSRLRECIFQQKQLEIKLGGFQEQDRFEKEHLLHPDAAGALYAPLLLKGKLKGFLVVELVEARPLDASQRSYLAFVADHVAQAIENSDAHYRERRRVRQLGMISSIAKQAVMSRNLEEFIHSASKQLREGLDYQIVQVWFEGPKPELLELKGYAAKNFRPEGVEPPVPRTVEECRKQDRIICNNCAYERLGLSETLDGIQSQLAVPIHLRGKLVGVLSVESDRLDAFSQDDVNLAEEVASLIATTLDNLRNPENAQTSQEHMRAILQSVKDLAILWTDPNGYVILNSIGTRGVLSLPDDGARNKDIRTLFTDPGFQTDLALYMEDVNSSTLERARVPQKKDEGGKDQFIDVTAERIYNERRDPLGFLCFVQDVTEKEILYQTLESLSITDELTGLYNQRHFFSKADSEIERARRYKKKLSICFFDLDGFKKFNDSHGHVLGDQVLRDTARMMIGTVRTNTDSCFRYGGDEFVILMPETDAQSAMTVAERLRIKLNEFFKGKISASIGIAEYQVTLNAQTLVDTADKAMYASKAAGGNSVVVAK